MIGQHVEAVLPALRLAAEETLLTDRARFELAFSSDSNHLVEIEYILSDCATIDDSRHAPGLITDG